MPRILTALPVLALVLAACGGGAEGTAIVASSPGSVGVGQQRVLLVLADAEGEHLADPTLEVTVELLREGEVVGTAPTEWVWAIEGVRGFYAARFDFPAAGTWEVVMRPEGRPPTPPTPFSVVEDVALPEVGEPAPRSETRTYPEVPLEELTTDPEPDPRLYEATVAEAVTGGTPSVIVFATPAFCQTSVCGPTLDVVKQVADAHPGATFVHVEVFENLDDPESLVPVEAVTEWRLQTEPWVFVVDAEGEVAARFEGTVGASELERALAAVGA